MFYQEKCWHKKTPFLGICLGMQILLEKSEEGAENGLGWVEGESKRFDFSMIPNGKDLKIPHMGWNTVKPIDDAKLFQEIDDEEIRYYFVHSYHVVCKNPENILSTTFYGYDFPSSIVKDNIYGVQFHPEKSHRFGMQLLKNFIGL